MSHYTCVRLVNIVRQCSRYDAFPFLPFLPIYPFTAVLWRPTTANSSVMLALLPTYPVHTRRANAYGFYNSFDRRLSPAPLHQKKRGEEISPTVEMTKFLKCTIQVRYTRITHDVNLYRVVISTEGEISCGLCPVQYFSYALALPTKSSTIAPLI